MIRRLRWWWQQATLNLDAGQDWACDPEQPDMPEVGAPVGPCQGCGKGTYRTVTLWPEDRTVFECASCRP